MLKSRIKKIMLLTGLLTNTVYAEKIVVLTDCGAVDPDDFIAAVTAYQVCAERSYELSFITEHVEPAQKRDALEALLGEVDVYAGEGYERGSSSEKLHQHTPFFPFDVFGHMIHPDQANGKKVWHPEHLEAFKDLVAKVPLKHPKISGVDHLIAQAKLCSPENPLIVMSLAPMLTLAEALKKCPDLGENMVVYSMGGAEEENRAAWHESAVGTAQTIKKPGYNWGVSPEQAALVMKHVQKMVVVPSQLPRDLSFAITEQEWAGVEPGLKSTAEGQVFLQERINCKGKNALKEQMMCDPLTVLVGLALINNPEAVPLTPAKVTWNCLDEADKLRGAFHGLSYFDPRVKEMFTVTKAGATETNVFFVKDVPFHKGAKKRVLRSLRQHFGSARLRATL